VQPALAALFGGPTAQRVIAAQPFPNLAHALTILVAGAGPGKVTKYQTRLCDTPAPKIYSGTAYAWAYTSAGGRADFRRATLIVPPDVLADPVGDWLTITPAPDEPVVHGPTFDISILGSQWADGTKRVYLILPPDPFTPPAGAGSWIPTVVHGAVGSQTEYFDSGVAIQSDGRITTAVTHLTPVTSLLQPSTLFPPSVTPGVTKAIVLANHIKEALLGNETPASCNPDITSRNDAVHISSDPTVLISGIWALERKIAAACAEGSLRNDHVLIRLTNTSALAFDVDPLTYPMPADTQSVTYQSDVNLLTRALLDRRANSFVHAGEDGAAPAYAQGTILTTSVPLGAERSTYSLRYNGLLTSAVLITNSVGQIAGIADVSAFKTCVAEIGIQDFSADTVIDCVKSAAETIHDPELLKRLAAVGRVLDVFQDGRALSETILEALSKLIGSDRFEGDASLQYTQTPKPNIDNSGRFVPSQCWQPDGATWTVDETCYQSYLANQSPSPTSCISGGVLDPQCQPSTDPGSPPDNSGCWQYDPYSGISGAWVLDATAGQGCLLLNHQVFCGVGPCVPWPDSSNHIVETSDGASVFIDARGGLWHLVTTDAFFACTAKFPILRNPAVSDGKWQPDNLNSYPYQGERYSC